MIGACMYLVLFTAQSVYKVQTWLRQQLHPVKDGGGEECRIVFFQVKQWMMLQEIFLLYMGVLSLNHCR